VPVTLFLLSYFRAEGLPAALDQIPLETFDRGLAWLAANHADAAIPVERINGPIWPVTICFFREALAPARRRRR
jgi:hypothetical protein